MAGKPVVLARFDSPTEAHEARIALEEAGIQAILADDVVVTLAFPGALGLGGVKLLVAEGDLGAATRILSHTPAANDLAVEPPQQSWFIAMPAQLEEKLDEWRAKAGERLRVDCVEGFSCHRTYALTLSDFSVPAERKRRIYVAQPHAHEPAATAGMTDIIEQLLTGRDISGQPTTLDVERVLATMVLTFNPIGNPQGRERAPVLWWDGSQFSNEEFWCWMRGEDPDNPGKMWHRFDVWDTRDHPRHPQPIGIVYEQIDEHRYVEPNRSHLSSYFRLFFKMDAEFHYHQWLDLHQTEFVGSPHDTMVLLQLEGLATGQILQDDIAWGERIIEAWQRAGFNPVPEPRHLAYKDEQADYLRRAWGNLHKRMNIISTEVKNNSPDLPPDRQMEAQALAIEATIEAALAT